jgi:hypothetical protein
MITQSTAIHRNSIFLDCQTFNDAKQTKLFNVRDMFSVFPQLPFAFHRFPKLMQKSLSRCRRGLYQAKGNLCSSCSSQSGLNTSPRKERVHHPFDMLSIIYLLLETFLAPNVNASERMINDMFLENISTLSLFAMYRKIDSITIIFMIINTVCERFSLFFSLETVKTAYN